MSKKSQIETIAQVAGVTKTVAEQTYTALVASIHDDLIKTGKAELHGVGNFKTAQRAARVGRNPRTGDKIDIPASVKVSFSASKVLKDAVAV